MGAVCRRHITLLELLIVIAILALAGGAVAIGVRKALDDQHFRSEVGLIVNELRLAQDLMLILGTDVHVKFAQDKDGLGNKFWLELETRLPPEIEREVLREHGNLKMVRGIFFRDVNTPQYTQGQVDVKFLSKGTVMSKGVMRLATSDQESPPPGTLQSYICLAGYPKPIFSVDEKSESDKDCEKSSEDAFDSKLTQDTIAKLPETLKHPAEEKDEEEKKNESENPETSKNSQSPGRSPKKDHSPALG